MRNLISGIIGIVLGLAIVLVQILRGGRQGEGAFAVGQIIGLIMGVLFFVLGVVYLILGIREVNRPPSPPDERRPPGPVSG
jgi:hypothetical protein